MLPQTIPIFPLPNVVLFPNVFLPLHIFEPRYRAMVHDALNGDRIIGMVLLRPGYEANYEGRPSIYEIGTAGVITHAEPLDDGRFNIVLRGVERFRVLEEHGSNLYRLASILALPEAITAEDRVELGRHRNRLQALLAVAMERAGSEPRFPPAVADEDLVNALAQYIELEPMERQALLEQHGVLKRCRALVNLLEMRTFAKRDSWKGGSVH